MSEVQELLRYSHILSIEAFECNRQQIVTHIMIIIISLVTQVADLVLWMCVAIWLSLVT